MKSLINGIIASVLIIGYIGNMYFLTADPETRPYQWINKVGIVVIPLGSIMGLVYIADKECTINARKSRND